MIAEECLTKIAWFFDSTDADGSFREKRVYEFLIEIGLLKIEEANPGFPVLLPTEKQKELFFKYRDNWR